MVWINLVGIGVIGLIVWWFWLYQSKSTEVTNGSVEILVKDGTYHPNNITVPANEIVNIIFYREDATPCAETLLIPELGVSETLPLKKKVTVSLPASEPGDYPFHCQMQMYKGKVTVAGS